MERGLTPKEERSRDRWRERGNLAAIQAAEGLSRAELAEKFRNEAQEKTDQLCPPTSNDTIKYNSAFYVLRYLFPPNKKGR